MGDVLLVGKDDIRDVIIELWTYAWGYIVGYGQVSVLKLAARLQRSWIERGKAGLNSCHSCRIVEILTNVGRESSKHLSRAPSISRRESFGEKRFSVTSYTKSTNLTQIQIQTSYLQFVHS